MCISDQGVKNNHKTQGLLYPEVRPPAWITPPQNPWKPHGLETSHELNSRQLQESYGNSVHWSAKNHLEAALSGSPPVACSSSFWICLNPLYQVVASCCSTFFALFVFGGNLEFCAPLVKMREMQSAVIVEGIGTWCFNPSFWSQESQCIQGSLSLCPPISHYLVLRF